MGLVIVTAFRKGCGPALGTESQQSRMVRLDQESDIVVDAADQRVKYVNREVDHRMAAGALQMGMAM